MVRGILAAMAMLLCAVLAAAQGSQVTNADIVKMLKAGVDQSTVKWVIEGSTAKLDASPAALATLKAAGANKMVLDAVTAKAKPQAAGAAGHAAKHTTKVKHGASAGNLLRNPATSAT